jgi:hypothetical protein
VLSAQFKKPFAEQLAFFAQKLNLPVADWRDLPGSYNDAAFYVTGALKADLINDLRTDVERAIKDGKGIDWFAKNFDALVEKHGWASSNAKFGDPAYRDWRARIVYQTNLSTSYAAGRYTQLTNPELLSRAPYWMYRHSDVVTNPRKWHVDWNKVTKLSTDPWWWVTGHMPPNGWGCRCYIIAVSRAEAERRGGKFGPAPGEGQTYTDIDRKTGEATVLPVGIDRGWDYAPGSVAADIQSRAKVGQKMEQWDRAVAVRYADFLRESPAFAAYFARAEALAAAIRGRISAGERIQAVLGGLPATQDLWPLAALSEADQAAVGASRAVVYLNLTNLAQHRVRHELAGAADYALIQRIIDTGELYQRAPDQLTYLAPTMVAGQEYRLGLTWTKFENATENYVATLFTESVAKNDSQVRRSNKYRRVGA